MGIYYFLEKLRWRNIAIVVLCFVYLAFFINFLIFFFFRYSVKQQVNHFLEERVLSGYLIRSLENGQDVYVTVDFPYRIFYEYVLFSNLLERKNLTLESGMETYKNGNLTVSGNCPGEEFVGTKVYRQGVDCSKSGLFINIQNQKDAGVIFEIYDDSLCDYRELTSWRRSHLISDYDIENMSDKEFCNRWIAK